MNAGKIRTILALAIALLFSATAMAQTAPYRPKFDKDKLVYVDPRAASNSELPLTLTGLESELREAGKKNNVTFYFVFVEEGDEHFNESTNYALPVLKEILRSWHSEPGFNRARHVLIVHTRKGGTKFRGKTAAEAGQDLKNIGLTGNRFDQMSGPVMKSVYEHMRVSTPDHLRFVLAISRHVNEEIDEYNSVKTRPGRQPSDERPSEQSDLTLGWLIAIFLQVIGLALGLLVMEFKRRARDKELTLNTQANCPSYRNELEKPLPPDASDNTKQARQTAWNDLAAFNAEADNPDASWSYRAQKATELATSLHCFRTEIAADCKAVERTKETLANVYSIRSQLEKTFPAGSSETTQKARTAALQTLADFEASVIPSQTDWRRSADLASFLDTQLVQLGQKMAADKTKYDEAIAKITEAKGKGCDADKLASAQAAADSGDYTAINGMLAGFIVLSVYESSRSSSSRNSGSSGSSCSSSSCGSSCGGGGCGGS